MTGVAEHEAALPDTHVEALRRLAGRLGVTPSAVILAAHAKVIATLAGERDVVTGYVATAAVAPLPCRLSTGSPSWRG